MKNNQEENSSTALAAIIVSSRTLGILKKEAREAMIELMKRKESGDEFDFSSYIDEKISQMPKPELNTNILDMLNSFSKMGLNKQ